MDILKIVDEYLEGKVHVCKYCGYLPAWSYCSYSIDPFVFFCKDRNCVKRLAERQLEQNICNGVDINDAIKRWNEKNFKKTIPVRDAMEIALKAMMQNKPLKVNEKKHSLKGITPQGLNLGAFTMLYEEIEEIEIDK